MSVNPKKVFVVHGRNWTLRDHIMAFLRAIGLSPISWGEAVRLTGINAAYIGEALDAALGQAQAVVVLLTGDDELFLTGDDELFLTGDDGLQAGKSFSHDNTLSQPRANVLFEAGMAFTRLADRTILVEFNTIRLPEALKGRWRVRLSNHITSRKAFIRSLQSANCAVDLPSDQVIRNTGDFRITRVSVNPSI